MDRMEVSGTSDKGSIPFGCTLKLYLQRVRLFIIVFSAHVWYMMLQAQSETLGDCVKILIFAS